MIYLSTLALIFLLVGLFTSKELIEVGQFLFFFVSLKCLFDNYKAKTLKLPKSAYWLIAFIFIALISIWINADIIPRPSINRAKLKYPLLGVLGIYFFRYWIKESSDKIKKIVINIFLVSVSFSSLYGIINYYIENQQRMNGLIFIMKQGYGSSLLLILLLGLLLNIKKFKHLYDFKLGLFTFIITFIAMFLTYTRGAMLGFLCSVPVLLYFYNKKVAYIFGSICLMLSLVMSGYYLLGKENTELRFLVTKENNSDSMRRSVWLSALYAIKERPIMGLGYNNFKHHMKRIKDEYNLPRKDFVDSHAHNNFLEIASGSGLVGLFIFMGWLITWAIESMKTYWGRALIAPFGIVFFISGQFEVTIIDSHLSALIYIIYSITSVLFNDSSIEQNELLTY